jgi:chemotaxis protein CheX
MLGGQILTHLGTSEQELIKILDKDVREIFSTMLGGEVALVDMADTATHFTSSVSAMVGFAGSYNGMISINTSHQLALKFSAQMLGMEPEECEEEISDSLGEIANMIGGSFKHHFVDDGHEVRLSTPSVVTGQDYEMTVCTLPDTLTLLFNDSEQETFTVSLYLEDSQ